MTALKIMVLTMIIVMPVFCSICLIFLMHSPLMGILFTIPSVFNLYYCLGMVEPDECIYREILAK